MQNEANVEVFDYVIVGAGAAGSVLAARLSEDGRTTVALLEAGPSERHPYVRIPAAYPRLFETRRDWAYFTEPQAALGGRRVYWPRGKMLGGSSSINAMLWVPGNPADYAIWRERAGPLWDPADLCARLRRIAGSGEEAKQVGAVAVGPQRDPSPLTMAFVKTARSVGIGALGTDGSGIGVGLFDVTQHSGQRLSAAKGYLRPAMRRRNLVVRTCAPATRVVFDGRRALGVTYRRGRDEQQVNARREVLLAAGAIGSPQLLQCSGIGPGPLLQELGIPIVTELRRVGAGLKDHLASGLVVETRRPVSLIAAQRAPALARYVLGRRGPLTSSLAEGVVFVRSDDRLDLPDLELLFAPVAFLEEGRALPRLHGVTLAAIVLQPESSGTVHITSPDPCLPPAIDPRYLSDPAGRDRTVLIAGIRRCAQLVASAPLAKELGARILPAVGAGGPLAPDDLVERSILETAQTLYHPVGTCAMGTEDGAVLDPRARVRGVEALRVVDASAMPNLNRGHTLAPTLALAERAAELIRES